MPRKKNGFGKTDSFALKPFKDLGRVDKGKGKGAAGYYPSNRQYGTSIHRSVIEKYNLDSDWVKWRKGYEYYMKAPWNDIKEYDEYTQTHNEWKLDSVLYQGVGVYTDTTSIPQKIQPLEVKIQFSGKVFPGKGDNASHYVVKREVKQKTDLGTVTTVMTELPKYENQQKNREVWVDFKAGLKSNLLFQMLGERVTDGVTEATLSNVLTDADIPAMMIGKSAPTYQETIVKVRVNKAEIVRTSYLSDPTNTLNSLEGKLVYINDFFVIKPKLFVDQLNVNDPVEFPDFFTVNLSDTASNQTIKILDTDTQFPPNIYDISTLTPLYESTTANAAYTITGLFVFQKAPHQRYYGRQYLTGDLAMSDKDQVSYTVLPFAIKSVADLGSVIELTSVPIRTELKTYNTADLKTLVFADHSFTRTEADRYDGNYYHQQYTPGADLWLRKDPDINPWMDEVFTNNQSLEPADLYSCSCPNYSQTILRAPQTTESEGTRKINRQRRYPLPTALSKSTFDDAEFSDAAGIMQSWESREHRMGFKMCKHTIAAMFMDKLKVKEPSSFPTADVMVNFTEKLEKEISEMSASFDEMYKREGLNPLEIVYAMGEGLNLDTNEMAYVMLNSR